MNKETTVLDFEFPEDKVYFEQLLPTLDQYYTLFDFRPAEIKRNEFIQERDHYMHMLSEKYGEACMLNLECCDPESGFSVDHLIPLSTNKLNKSLRKLRPQRRKKVKAQSFGSNHPDNLIVACNKCNIYKKHRILDSEKLLSILNRKKQE